MLQPQWAAIGTVAPFVVVLLSGGVFRSLRAREIVYKRFHADCQASRAAVEGIAIIPALAALIEDVNSRSIADGVGLTETLQQIRFREPLGVLASYYDDLQLIQRLPHMIERVMQWEGWSLGLFIASALLIVTPYCVKPLAMPAAATFTGYALTVLGALATGALCFREARRRNQLVALFQKYDEFEFAS